MRYFSFFYAVLATTALTSCQASAPSASNVTGDAVSSVYADKRPSFESTVKAAKAKLDAQMGMDIMIPTPKDAGGGYTHEKHKENAKLIYDAGQLYKLTGDAKYAEFAAKMMEGYAAVYPSWGLHPEQKEQSPGRMFWQNLNESWWLLHVSQSYGAIKDTLSQTQRDFIETDLLRNVAKFLSEDAPETFNKIHNHGTWATAAVGLTGYAIGDMDYVEQALMGLDKSGEAGFLKQLERLFSPDGYYNEGPYYQRYALMPFVVFAQAVERNNPERKIFDFRDGILKKAIYTTVQQSYGGLFFPINDSLKDKGIATTELLYGVSIAYDLTGDKGLLSIADAQGKFVLTPESRAVSKDLLAGKAEPFDYRSMRLSDGAGGTEGALDIIRASNDPNDSVVVMKNTSQGLGHGHFDKMGFIFYDSGHEILTDYGAARFLNVEAKFGGHYLAENNSFAKQTIAHNALTVDETSHFNGSTRMGNQHHPEVGPFVNTGNVKASTAEIDTAYSGVTLRRTMAMITDDAFAKPVVIDLMQGISDGTHQYDLPFYYNGQLIDTNFEVQADPASRSPLGTKNGYQHLWRVADASPLDGQAQVTWLKDRRFYTVSSDVPKDSSVLFAEVGATDPNFNLRREQAFILRAKQSGGVNYASVIEPHGEYNPTVEFTLNSHSQVAKVEYFAGDNADYVQVETKAGAVVGLGIAKDMASDGENSVTVDGQDMRWSGPYKLFHSAGHNGQNNGEP